VSTWFNIFERQRFENQAPGLKRVKAVWHDPVFSVSRCFWDACCHTLSLAISGPAFTTRLWSSRHQSDDLRVIVPWCHGPGHVYSACSALCSQRLGWVTQNTQVAETDLSFQIDSNSHSPCKIPVVTATRTGLNLPQWNPRTVPSNAVHRPVWDPICDHFCLCVVPGGLSLISLIPILLQGRIRICKLSHNMP
jgi:hypothetical protein